MISLSEVSRPIPWNSMESDLGCASMKNANTITSVIAEKQMVINEVNVFSIKKIKVFW